MVMILCFASLRKLAARPLPEERSDTRHGGVTKSWTFSPCLGPGHQGADYGSTPFSSGEANEDQGASESAVEPRPKWARRKPINILLGELGPRMPRNPIGRGS